MEVAKRRSDSVGGSNEVDEPLLLLLPRPNTLPPPLLLSSEELRAWLAEELALALEMASEVAAMCLVMAR